MSNDFTFSRRQALNASLLTAFGLTTASARGAQATPAATPSAVRPLAQDYTIIHKRMNPKTYVEGCGMIVLPDGAILAIVPVVPRGGVPKKGPTEINFVRSDDAGKTWKTISQLPFYSAAPFLHDGKLYMFLFSMGTTRRNDDVYLASSTDGGATWSKPVAIFKGHFWTCHTNMVVRDNRLYWSIDELIRGSTLNRSPRAIVGDLSADLMAPASWRLSNLVLFPGIPHEFARADYSPEKLGIPAFKDHWLEADVVEVGGRLRLLATVKSQRQTTTNFCGVCDLNDDGKDLKMSFTQYHPMTGGHLKFAIVRDEASQMFWATANFAVDSQETNDWFARARKTGHFTGSGGNDRRFLMLLYSVDALNWFQAGCVAQAAELRQSFMYGKPVVDGNDMLVISRSSIDGPNQHDADCATFHRIRNFRSLALNLFPKDIE